MTEIDLDVNLDGGDEPVSLIDGEGNFTDAFSSALPGYLGKETLTKEDGSPIKMFDDVKNIGSLVKMAHDSKVAASRKLDNVIQKPGENATEDEIAKYMGELDTARGVPSDEQSYEFKLAEGQQEVFSDNEMAEYKKFAKDNGVTSHMFDKFVELNRKLVGDKMGQMVQAEKDADDKVIGDIKMSHPGEGLATAGKMVFNALSKFNTNNPEFLEKLKGSDAFNKPTDFENWKSAGVTPANFQAWLSIAQELKISHSVNGAQNTSSDGDLSTIFPESAKAVGAK